MNSTTGKAQTAETASLPKKATAELGIAAIPE